jgi:hypothetical protein
MQTPPRSRELEAFSQWAITGDDAEGQVSRAMRIYVGTFGTTQDC